MSIQITFLGLGQIGTSIGLGLSDLGEKFHRVGYDQNSRLAKLAKKKSAIDNAEKKIADSVVDADIVVLAMAFDEVEQTMEAIADNLKENVILLDTSPIRRVSMEWAEEYLPESCNYVGFTPMISPAFLEKMESGFEAASADLFKGGSFAITASKNTSPEAVNLAVDLAEILKASVLFADIVEIDGLMASVHIMPQLISAALVNSNTHRKSWKEGRKFAGRPFAVSGSLIENQDSPAALAKAAVVNKENTVRVVDDFIRELQILRDEVSEGSAQTVEEILDKARLGRMKWMGERTSADWSGENSPKLDMEASKRNWAGSLIGKRKKD